MFIVPSGNADSGHLYWRVRGTAAAIRSDTGAGTYFGMREIEFRGSISGSDLASGGTASASSTRSGSPAAAFDNAVTPQSSLTSLGNLWCAYTAGATGDWISYQFATPVTVTEVAIYPYGTYNSSLGDRVVHLPGIAIDFSDNGTDWTEQVAYSPGNTWTAYTWKTFIV